MRITIFTPDLAGFNTVESEANMLSYISSLQPIAVTYSGASHLSVDLLVCLWIFLFLLYVQFL